MSSYDVDLFVIGAGSGGVRAARIAAGHGAKVAIAEKQYYGGTCVNVGCVPKKLMTYAAQYAVHIEDSAGYGWAVDTPQYQWSAFISNKNKEIERLNRIYQKMLNDADIKIYWGAATLIDPHTVSIEEEKITAKRILIATGGKAFLPDIPGAKEYGITSDDVFYLPKMPKRLVIVGVGYIGLEFAGIFNGLGNEVHVIYRRDKILNDGFDEDIRTFLHTQMSQKDIHFHAETTVQKIEEKKNTLHVLLSDGQTLKADQVLFATGRNPNIEGMGFETLGIKTNPKTGAIIVNKDEQTNIPSIYAVGDVTDRIALTPIALAEGHALADRLYGDKGNYISYENVPSAVFSDPPVSQVGLTESQARKKYGDQIDIYTSEFRAMRMILANRNEKTLMKLIVHRDTDKVLGLHMVARLKMWRRWPTRKVWSCIGIWRL